MATDAATTSNRVEADHCRLRFRRPAGWPTPPPGWIPTPGWHPGPDVPGVPTGTVLVETDDGDRPGWLWRRVPRDGEQKRAVTADRRPPGAELLIVLAIFPLSSVLSALAALVQQIDGAPAGGGYLRELLPDHPVQNALLNVPFVLVRLAPVLLVAYLLSRSRGGLAAVGLDLRRPRADLAPTAKLLLLAYLLPTFGITLLLRPIERHVHGVAVPHEAIYLVPLLLGAVMAGVAEEIIVLGYLTHRLEQRGWSGVPLVAVLVAVRLSYHVYYGLGALNLLGWAVLSVVLYRRRRRLLPFIVAHALWDGTLFLLNDLSRGPGTTVVLLLGVVLLGVFLVGRRAKWRAALVVGTDGAACEPDGDLRPAGVPGSVGEVDDQRAVVG